MPTPAQRTTFLVFLVLFLTAFVTIFLLPIGEWKYSLGLLAIGLFGMMMTCGYMEYASNDEITILEDKNAQKNLYGI